jgi:hypothetical protein
MRYNRLSIADEPRLKLAADFLLEKGGPKQALLVVSGAVFTLHHYCYASRTDEVGTPEDVEIICGWSGIPRLLCFALVKGGFLADVGGVLACVTALREAPEHTYDRWKKEQPDTFEVAHRRATPALYSERALLEAEALAEASRDVATPFEPRWEVVERDLFGQEVATGDNGYAGERKWVTRESKRPSAAERKHPAHQAFVAWWCQRYNDFTGAKYPFTSRDGDAVRRILYAVKDLAVAKLAAERFFASPDPYYRGWSLHKLAHGPTLKKFVEGGRVTGEYRSQAPDSLPYRPRT